MEKNNFFTLADLVVLVMILVMLASVAVSRFFNVSAEKTDAGLKHTFNDVREAIDIYAGQSNGRLPPCTGTVVSTLCPRPMSVECPGTVARFVAGWGPVRALKVWP